MPDYFPRRIVSLQPSATVILAAIGALDRLVACTKYCADVCPAAAQGRVILADSWTANATEILSAYPDLVIAAVPYQEKAIAEIMKAGARFLGLAPRSLADIYTDIAAIAGIMGASDRGERAIEAMQSEIHQTSIALKTSHRPRVFCEEWGKPLIASQPWVAELVTIAGGDFVGEPGKQTTPEQVLEMNPDVLIAAWCGAGDRVPLPKIIRDRGWQSMQAARDSRVYCIRDEFLNTPAPTVMQGLRALAAAIHPEAFPAVDGLLSITEVQDRTRAIVRP
jgi:iron complex transport system substrate-binding protein